ncbi:TonB-dependent siderophore receptor [Terriglobus roseus]|uniref:TonB-dependent siderophore receptor n=1 Tax=Terriglobus roseus TaxID=392734 RepID=UPI00094474B6|nr:TonB-dependent siderophore receptor [Terriglobus roseus]
MSLSRTKAGFALAAAALLLPGLALAAAPDTCSVDVSVPAVPVSLTVRDASGATIDRAAVQVVCGATVRTLQTAQDGSVTVSLHPGHYRVTVQAAGFAQLDQADVILPQGDGPAALTLHPGSATDVVNVTAQSGFVPFDSNAGSKTNAALIEVPQSISIVNQLEMESRNVITMNEALRYTAGVQADEFGVEPRFDWLKLRGFAAETFGVFRDGMRFNSLSGKLDPYELESVEVLRGPSSVLYGEVPPGGLINQVTKRPSAERHTEIGGQYGAYDRRQFQFDTTGPFDHAQVWRYRLLGLIRNSGTQTAYTPDNRRLIAPSLTYHPGDRTNFTVLGDWQHDRTQWSQFLPSQGTLTSNPNGVIPISAFVGEPGFDKVTRDQASFGYTGDHLLQDGWNVHSNYRYQYINFHGQTIYGGGFDGTSLTNMIRYAYTLPTRNRINTVDNRALRRFHTGDWEQTLLFGYDYQHVAVRSSQAFQQVADINIYHPVYGVTTVPTLSPYVNQDNLLQQHGLYVQDQIKYRNHLIFTLGGRQDFARNDTANFLTNTESGHLDQRFTGRVGVSYLTSSGISPYVAYSTSFLPNAGSLVYNATTGLSTTPAKPSDSRQIEAGVKVQPATWNSYLTAAFFQINQTNVLVSNAAFQSYQSGEVRSRGVELEAVASLHHGLSLHGSYTFTGTETLQDQTTANIGKWLPQTPRNQVGMLTDYTVRGGRFAGLGGNFGVRFTGKNAADSANTFFVPDYALMDAGLRFGYRGTLFSVNATNLTDKRYVATCSGASYCYYGYARNVIGSAKYTF